MRPPVGKSAYRLLIVTGSTKTTGLRFPTNTHERERERQMRRFKSEAQMQGFLAVDAAVHNSFRLARHRLKAIHHRLLREQAFATWNTATGVR